MKKVLGMGNALVDILIRLQSDDLLAELNFPKGSMQLIDETRLSLIYEKIEGKETTLMAGGSAANTIAGLARLGNPCGFIGKTGQDALSDVFFNDMVQCGILPSLLKNNTPSGRAIAFISPDSERTFGTFLGAAAELEPDDLLPEMFSGYDFFYIEGYLVQNHALIERAVTLAKDADIRIAIDLASYNVVESNLDFLRHLIQHYAYIVFANEEEAKALTGKNPEKALSEIAGMCEIAVVKVGADGAFIKQKDIFHHVATIPAIPVDTTGAGDLYAAGFMHGLSLEKPLPVCGEYGSILAGNIVEVVGPKMSDDRWLKISDEIKKL
ncbi:MAG: adenosine kinase [Candidatus Azobacteroides sp.]|nr:adenosine kinase [Candidatus Azobacteroides sp.]